MALAFDSVMAKNDTNGNSYNSFKVSTVSFDSLKHLSSFVQAIKSARHPKGDSFDSLTAWRADARKNAALASKRLSPGHPWAAKRR